VISFVGGAGAAWYLFFNARKQDQMFFNMPHTLEPSWSFNGGIEGQGRKVPRGYWNGQPFR